MKTLYFMATTLAALYSSVSQAALNAVITQPPGIDGYFLVELTGINFGDGPEILLYDDFSSHTVGQTADLNGPLIGKWNNSSSYPSKPKIVEYNGSNAFSIRDFSGEFSVKIAQLEFQSETKISSVFLSYSVVVPEGRFFSGASEDYSFPDASSWKFTWITDGESGIGSTSKFNVCTPTHGGKGSFLLAGNSVNFGWVELDTAWSWHTPNYISFGILPHPSSPQTEPGLLYFHLTGKKDSQRTVTKNSNPIYPMSNTTSFDIIKFPGWFGNGDTSNFDAYYDNIYIATGPNAFSRVEISDSDDLETSIVNLTMPISIWTSDKVIFKMSKENLTRRATMFVRVYDSNNISQTAVIDCQICPKAPL